MRSDVQICNIALGRIGVQQFINSIDDPSSEAIVASMVYDFTLERVLQDFPWPFATRHEVLQDIGSPVSPWAYRYRYPGDCLQVRRIYPAGGTYTDGTVSRNTGIPYSVISDYDNDARAILCDYEAPMIEYTAKIIKPGLFTPAFANAFAWALASEMATPLSADAKFAQAANQAYARVLAEAGTLAFGESQQEPLPDGELLAARNA